jgi:hypothetical protein
VLSMARLQQPQRLHATFAACTCQGTDREAEHAVTQHQAHMDQQHANMSSHSPSRPAGERQAAQHTLTQH